MPLNRIRFLLFLLAVPVFSMAGCSSASYWDDDDRYYTGRRYDYYDRYGYYRDPYSNSPHYGYPYSRHEREKWERRHDRLQQQEQELEAEKAKLERQRRQLRREQRQAAERQRQAERQNERSEQNKKSAGEKQPPSKEKQTRDQRDRPS
jgi:outer membrane murein-binding lipoprotein Lpp